MELFSIKIKNFKSIKYIDLKLNNNYYVIAGKNESGKSNILNAISFIDPTITIDSKFIREPLPDEKPVDESYIYFVFRLTDDEINEIYDEISPLFFGVNKDHIIGEAYKAKINLISFIKNRSESLISIDFIKKKRLYLNWAFPKSGYNLNKNIKKILDSCPESFSFVDEEAKLIQLKKYKFVNIDKALNSSIEHIADASFEDISTLISNKISALLKNQLNNSIFWYYKEENLLPSKIDMALFKENPSICYPLIYLFNLASITDIKSEIDLAISKSTKAINNLLLRVSKHSSLFFKEKWKEYDEIEFNLSLNGSNIEIGIKEQNNYDFSQRSDGFKRFVTFLIMISAKVKTNQLNDTIIIIDEPEIGLHPSGQRFLRDELRKISETNTVIFSTHSIFLIDPDNLENHYIVEKTKESTNIKEVGKSNIIDEEVIFNALGYSVFENLKHYNILFEGWRDKYLFHVAISKLPDKFKELKELKEIGLTHAKGVKDIKHIVPILELANRNCIILSDSDKPARERQAEYIKEYHYANWYRYDQLLDDEIVITGEDFIKAETILTYLNKIKMKLNLIDLNEPHFDHPKGKIHVITEWLKPIGEEKVKEELEKMKESLFNNLKSNQIEDKYYKLLIELNKKFKK